MLIKYKGNTSNLLKDLSLELGNSVDLKTSEIILTAFFNEVLQRISIDKAIELISNLPPCLKPFCQKRKEDVEIYFEVPRSFKEKNINEAVLRTIEKYVSIEKAKVIYPIFPEHAFPETLFAKKDISIAA